MKKSLVWIALGVALAMAGCTLPHQPAAKNDAVAKDLAQLKAGQRDLSAEMGRLRDNLVLLEGRFQDQQKTIDKLRQALVAQKVTPSGEKAVKEAYPAAAPPGEKKNMVPAPTEIYLKAFSDYASGHFQEAISGFESFLRLYPDSDFAGNAQYWLGECYYSLQQYPQAAEEFTKAAKNYPQGHKTPDALLKMAATLRQMNQPEQAAETLRLLQERYPDSPAAQKARKAVSPAEKK
jgi:tol-pal system protein YbgF